MGTLYTFGRSRFDPARGELTVDGRACPLRPRTAAVLEELLKRPGGLVTREQLLRAVWQGRVVTPNSVEQCVSELRRDLDGDGTTLRTVPRRGYLLQAEVRSTEASSSASGARSLAVMPLDMESKGAAGRFASALTRELIAAIAQDPCVQVVSGSTAASCAAEARDVRSLGHELGVDYVVEGCVARDGRGWKVALTASETRQARQVWAARLEGDARTVAARASAMLMTDLTAIEAQMGGPGLANDARAMTRRAYYLWMRDLPQVSSEALKLAEAACAVDGKAAGPWAFIAYWHACSVATRSAAEPAAAIATSELAARKALELDPSHRLAYGALGWALTLARRHDAALAAFERQMALNPTPGTHHLLGRLHLLRGEPRRALAEVDMALALSPRDARIAVYLDTLALAHLHSGHDRRAVALALQSVAEPRPWPRSYETLAMALALNGRMAAARDAIATLLRHWPRYTVARHRAELPTRSPEFLSRHARLLRALARAGL